MMNQRRNMSAEASADAGLTLIEVLAAIIVIIIVALASAGLSINGIKTAAAQERNQVAVTIANGSMENVSGWSVATNSTTTVSNLFTGRYKNTTQTAFTNFATYPGVSQTYPGYDPTASATATPAIALTVPGTQNGTAYTTTTLLGYCYELLTGGTCGLAPGYASLPTTVPAGYTQLIRAIVIVTWPTTSNCASTGCYYQATTLIDPHTDLQWVTH